MGSAAVDAEAQPVLHRRFPSLRRSLPHLRLGRSPTPVRRLESIGDTAPVWLKNDGLFGGAWGGNKARKLEWVLADARARGFRTILTVGALGTNHGLATALYAREHGLRAALMLVDQPEDDHVRAQFRRIEASGAAVHRTRGTLRTIAALPLLLAWHTDLGARRPPYFLGVGGSSPTGCLGYVQAGLELAEQVNAGALPEPAYAVVPLGSGGTAAGLALGFALAGLRTRVVAVLVNDRMRLDEAVLHRLARRTTRLLRRRGADLPAEAPDLALSVRAEWLGDGYGHPTPAAERARARLRRDEDLDLDPVYTAKAMAGLIELESRGELGDGPVVYWHTHDALHPQ